MIQPIKNHPVTLDHLLETARADQQDLSAVARFGQLHDAGEVPAQERYYRDLLPVSVPGPNQQYAFEVDLDRCTACKACVTACHNLNGLDEHEAWRSTGLLVGNDEAVSYQQTVTTACHHCLEPACSDGCPVNAYEKHPVTGIVRHLDDQCIGCKYCTLTCPYDVPKFNPRMGIVRKCDMCSQRLSVGEAPACVQACPNQAIRISLVQIDQITRESLEQENQFLPGSPHPEHTRPTTRFVSQKPMPEQVAPADGRSVKPEHGHLPLVIMLTLTQMSVGACLALVLAGNLASPGLWEKAVAIAGAVIAQLGMIAALFHLGRPQYAFRALLGLRRSWLSREILAFGLFSGAALATAGALVLLPQASAWLNRVLAGLSAFSGVAAIYTSVMVYHVTRRPSWDRQWGGRKFFLTAAVLGSGLGFALAAVFGLPAWTAWCAVLIPVVFYKLHVENGLLQRCERGIEQPADPLAQSAWLLQQPLRKMTLVRIGLGWTGGLVLPVAAFMLPGASGGLAVVALTLLLAGELSERWLFFTSMTAPRMPGNATT